MLCLARLIRWAMVASGTRNAWAISAVVKPPTARNVSAIAEAGVNAGWQHMKRRTSVSSSCGAVSMAVDSGAWGRLQGHLAFATAASRFAANVVGHPPEGDLRQPCAGIVRQAIARPLHRRGKRRLLNGVLRRREVAKSSDDGAEHLRRQLPQQVLDRNVQGCCHDLRPAIQFRIEGRSSLAAPRWACSPGSLRGQAPPKPARRSCTPAPGSPRQ